MIYSARYLVTSPERVVENGSVLVRGGAIEAVFEEGQPLPPDEQVCDLGNCCLIPGFVNAHAHLEPTFRRNFTDALNLWDWLPALGFRRDTTPSPETLAASAALGAGLCALTGITCIGDSTWSGASAQAMARIGLRGIAYREFFGQSFGQDYAAKLDTLLHGVLDMRASLPSSVGVGVSPHSIYSSTPEVLEITAKTCAELDIPVALHLAETAAEASYSLNGSGPLGQMRRDMGYEPVPSGLRPVRLVEQCGLLRQGVCLAHCIHLNEDEIASIAASGASIAHCPRSNALLGAGIAPFPALLARGAVVGLGTDSAASCLRLDMFEEMRVALMVHRAAAQEASVLTAKDVFALATAGGAAALGLAETAGTLEPGKRADMVAVDFSDVLSGEDLFLALLSRSPADVTMVMVDGEQIMSNGRLVRASLRDLCGELDEVRNRDKDNNH